MLYWKNINFKQLTYFWFYHPTGPTIHKRIFDLTTNIIFTCLFAGDFGLSIFLVSKSNIWRSSEKLVNKKSVHIEEIESDWYLSYISIIRRGFHVRNLIIELWNKNCMGVQTVIFQKALLKMSLTVLINSPTYGATVKLYKLLVLHLILVIL